MSDKIDILNRQPFIEKLVQFVSQLSDMKRGCAFAIDGKWGAGKTFILEEFEEQIELIQSEETMDDKFFLFHYNCWQYDYYAEPSIAIISAMLDKAESMVDKRVGDVVKDSWKCAKELLSDVAGTFIKNKIGINVVDIIEKIDKNGETRKKEEREFDTLFSFKKTLEETRKKLQEISMTKTVVLVVDELDRCLPGYAIKVLERMHHLFEGISNIVVLYAIDSEQLYCSIQKIYGDDADIERYLKKFISFKFSLELGEVQEGFERKYEEYLSQFVFRDEEEKILCYEVIQNVLSKSQLDIRNQEKMMEKIMMIHSLLGRSEVDASVMLCEIISTMAKYKTKNNNWGKDLYWLPEINRAGYSELDKSLGEQLLEYLKKIEQKVGNGMTVKSGNGTLRACGDRLLDRTFFCLGALYCKNELYYIISKFDYEIEMDLCKRFDELGDLIV